MSAALLTALLDVVRRGTPDLPDAACRGRAADFDLEPGSHPDLIEYAIHQCNACPALTPCREWVARLRPSRRPCGVVAGELHAYEPPRRKAAS